MHFHWQKLKVSMLAGSSCTTIVESCMMKHTNAHTRKHTKINWEQLLCHYGGQKHN